MGGGRQSMQVGKFWVVAGVPEGVWGHGRPARAGEELLGEGGGLVSGGERGGI